MIIRHIFISERLAALGLEPWILYQCLADGYKAIGLAKGEWDVLTPICTFYTLPVWIEVCKSIEAGQAILMLGVLSEAVDAVNVAGEFKGRRLAAGTQMAVRVELSDFFTN